MGREALIIYSGSDEQRQQEVERIREFLRSNHGGAWEDYEITVAPDDCSEAWLTEYFTAWRSTTFYLLFYIGQKHYDERKGIIYSLPSGEQIRWMWLRVKTRDVPTLLITDGCRLGADEGKGGERRNDDTASVVNDKKRKQCRKMYDEALEYPAWGMFVTASSDDMEATMQETSQTGGCYLEALFEAAEKILTSSSRKPDVVYSIDDVHRVAAKKVKELTGGGQTPSLTGTEKKRQLPFLVRMRKRKKKKIYKAGRAPAMTRTSDSDDLTQS